MQERLRTRPLPRGSACVELGAALSPALKGGACGGRFLVQELLGHARITVTADLYAHVSPKLKRDAVAKLGSRVPGGITASQRS